MCLLWPETFELSAPALSHKHTHIHTDPHAQIIVVVNSFCDNGVLFRGEGYAALYVRNSRSEKAGQEVQRHNFVCGTVKNLGAVGAF